MIRYGKLRRFLVLAQLAWFIGCNQAGPEGPDAIPVQGKLVYLRGGDVAELAGCQAVIELQSIERPDIVAAGEIGEDGSFELVTLDDGITREGLTEGKHRVRLRLDESAEQLVAPQFTDFSTSGIVVQVPFTDTLEIKVWR